MYHNRNSLLRLKGDEIKTFFLKSENYVNFPLPPYFNFSELLEKLSHELKTKKLSSIWKRDPKYYEEVNYQIFGNKDGKFAWRPYQIISPIIYADMVNYISEYKNWRYIKKRFGQLRGRSCVSCFSLPIVNSKLVNTKKDQILNWWEEIEQKSISLSIKYNYLHQTDITDCYSSIYTHSVAWALHDKEFIKISENKNNKDLIGNKIDIYLQQIDYGQTNGIPQGSTLMDFIAEIILIYADYQLTKKINELNTIKDFQILRYRDDYRIFTNNPSDGEEVLKQLTYVLTDLGLKLNSNKTKFSKNIIKNSLKQDKYYGITKFKQQKNIYNYLLNIYDLAENYPNSGAVEKHLHKLHIQIKDWDSIPFSYNYDVLVAIIVEIITKNPRTYPIGMGIISKIISIISKNKRNDMINIIRKKFAQIPNTGFLNIWTQRVTIKLDKSTKYEEKLCKKLYESGIQLWNIEWISNKKMKNIIQNTSIIDEIVINELDMTIKPEEINFFIY